MSASLPRRARDLSELAIALLCCWAAYHHTPAGALARGGLAKLTGTRTSARPLLAYFSGGAPGGQRARALPPLPQSLVTPERAQGLGLYAALAQLPLEERGPARALARAHRVEPDALFHPKDGPKACARMLRAATKALGSGEAATLAAFSGVEPARFAVERARAEGQGALDLQSLARQLPFGFDTAVERAQDALALGTAYGLGWPVAPGTQVTSGFGVRTHPTLGGKRMHTGVDLAVRVGTPVRVTGAGVVRRASEDAVNGRVLVVDHGAGVSTAYCHNDLLLVRVGEQVERGQVIARSGNTGRSTGPHLHYQLELGGGPVDPLAFRRRALDFPLAEAFDG